MFKKSITRFINILNWVRISDNSFLFLKHNYHCFVKHNNIYNKPLFINFVFHSKQYSSHNILHEVLKLRDKNTSNSIIDNNVKELCTYYKCLNLNEKHDFILELACKYSIHHEDVCKVACNVTSEHENESQKIRLQEKLKTVLRPQYKWLFIHIGRQENGIKFLVDMRATIIKLIRDKHKSEDARVVYLKQLDNTLKDIFMLWFNVGLLKLEKVTWKSSCEMLEKISDYEAVHPVRNWPDLKKRMGPDRRCFVYTHSSMPEEPLVILHTALRREIVNSTSSMISQNKNIEEIQKYSDSFDPDQVTTVIFYSISASQLGLQGIELGNYIIKRVATELSKEFPKINKFSSLSPIPNYKNWFFEQLKRVKSNSNFKTQLFQKNEIESLKTVLNSQNMYEELKKLLNSNNWLQNECLISVLKPILMRACLHYLYVEKKRGYALNNVANFHLRNGAVFWRLNWLADDSARGLATSCGIMVNYRYYLDQTELNSKNYIENKKITVSPLIEKLLRENDITIEN